MIHRQHRALITLNAALLGVLALVVLAPVGGFGSQPDRVRGRGNYTMVGAEYTGGPSNAIIILDAQNQEMIAMYWFESKKSLQPLRYRDLAADARRVSRTPGRK